MIDIKFSKQRELTLNYVLRSDQHPTAESVYESLKKDNPNLSLGTVYRNLSQLEEHGLLRKVNIPGMPVRYDGNLAPHDHFVCENCGKIIDIEPSEINVIPNKSLEGSSINGCYIVLSGLCKDCNK